MRIGRWVAGAVVIGLGASLGAGFGHTASAATADPGPLAQYYDQHLTWHGCELPDLDQAGVQCTEVRVPLDYANPGGRGITVALSRSVAPDTAHRIGSLVFNLGGPAIPVLGRVLDARLGMGTAGARFDLIGMDTRFSGRSMPLDCQWPQTWLPRSAGADRRSFDRMVALSRDLAQDCARRAAAVLPFASTLNQARDMDVVRAALGEPKLSYLGYSYGSYLGALYTQLFPERADRIVLDSAIDPNRPGVNKGDNAPQREAALRDWAGWAAARDTQYHLGTTPSAVLSTVDHIYQAAARRPLRVGSYQVDDTTVPALLLDPLSDDGDAGNVDLAERVQVLAQAAAGQPAEPTDSLEAALAGLLTGTDSSARSTRTAIMCADAPVSRDVPQYWRDLQAHRAATPLFGPVSWTISPCAFWPSTPAAPRLVHNAVPALVVQAAGDVNATLDLGQAMHQALTKSRMVTLDGVRTHGVYLFNGNACVDSAVNDYLVTGALPAGDLTCTR
jgi:pimeloyl-ACP methyl ester carboxylesterase